MNQFQITTETQLLPTLDTFSAWLQISAITKICTDLKQKKVSCADELCFGRKIATGLQLCTT